MATDERHGAEDGWNELSWGSKRQYVLRRDGYQCRRCEASSPPMEVDHRTPLSEGGTDDPANLQTLCVGCHMDKHEASISELGEDRIVRAGKAARYESGQETDSSREVARLTARYLHLETTEENVETVLAVLQDAGVTDDGLR